MLSQNDLLQALPVAVYTTDAAGRITYYNEAAAELWGHRPILGKSEWCGSWLLRWPDGRPMRHDECPMAVALREGQPIRGAEAIAERPDGSLVPFLAYPTPLRDDAGTLIGAVLEGLGNPDAVVGVGVQLLLPTAGAFTGLLDTAFSVASIFVKDLAGGFIPLPGLPSSIKIRVGPLAPSSTTFDFDGTAGHYVYTSTIGV